MAQQRSGFLLLLLLLHEPLAGPQVQFELLHDPWVPLSPLNELLQRDLTWNKPKSSEKLEHFCHFVDAPKHAGYTELQHIHIIN